MDELNRALGDIRGIRRQLALNTEFRGYGPLTIWTTAALAVVAGVVQTVWVPQPEAQPLRYAALWIGTAVVSLALIAAHTLTRTRRIHSALANDMIRMAAEQFLPSAVAGTLLTIVILRLPATNLWLLPGLWQVVYSLGVFASCRFLPRPVLAAGAWFLGAGLLCLTLGDAQALSPVMMAGSYAIGQTIIGAILYVSSKEAADEL